MSEFSKSVMTWNFAYLARFGKDNFCLFGGGAVLPFRQTIGMSENRIKELREARGMTLEALAERVGLSASYVQRLENGERNLSLKHIQSFADALEVGGRDILPEDNSLPPVSRQPYTPLPPKIIKSRSFKFYVAEWREFMGVSVNDAARALGLSEGQYEVLEYYPINFTLAQVVELADLFGVRGDQFWFPAPKNRPASSPATRDTASKRRASK